ncbi:MAG: adenosine deaminase [Pseudomonadota bacterium]
MAESTSSNDNIEDFIQALPKAELHVHFEGTLEPEHIFALAERNEIKIPYSTPEEVLAAYDFHDLPSFLTIYYAAMEVLQTEEDFYELAYHYFQKAAAQNVVYVEPFFDPQAHTRRGVAFETVINGIEKAQKDAEAKLGVRSNLIMCFLRDMSAESAAEHLELAIPHLDKMIGVGLDSDEKDNPPSKFASTFARARELGMKLTMHCDVNQKDILEHIDECLNLIQVDRIDHGVNSLDDDRIAHEIAKRGIGLTVCPVSNRFVVQNLTGSEIRSMLEQGIKATVNSDDPAYFRAYMNENLLALAEEADFSREELKTLTRNAFEVSWLDDSSKTSYLARVNAVQ